jgi:hypothetical protein
VLLDAVLRLLAGVQGEAVAGADPGDVGLAHPDAGGDLGLLLGQVGLGPQAEFGAVSVQHVAGCGEVLVAAAVAVVDQHPAERHALAGVAVGDRAGVAQRLAFTAVGVVQVAVGVAEFHGVHRQHGGAAGEFGVSVDDLLGVADEVVGVEALFLVGGAYRCAEVVASGGEGVAQDAVAVAGEVERRRVRVAAVVPVVVAADVDALAAVAEAAVLHAAAEELLLCALAQGLRGSARRPGQRCGLPPQLSAVLVGEGQGDGRLGDRQGRLVGADDVGVVGLGVGRVGALVAGLDDDVGVRGGGIRGVVVRRVGEVPVGGEADAEEVVVGEADAELRVARGDGVGVAVRGEAGGVAEPAVGGGRVAGARVRRHRGREQRRGQGGGEQTRSGLTVHGALRGRSALRPRARRWRRLRPEAAGVTQQAFRA